MCGIAGAIGPFIPELLAAVRQMSARLGHRGPDADGFWTSPDGRVAFGHRRLAIIDLSDDGRQPMTDAETGTVIIFNGEIYNYLRFRDELARLGHRFRTGTDTEVILRGYRQWGTGCVSHLRGMFAFALRDGPSGRVIARDRVGIKPLYFAPVSASGGELVLPFASVRGVGQFPAGSFAVLDPARPRVEPERYWHLPTRSPRPSTDIEPVRAALEESVRQHLISDVPLGVFLSGGVVTGLHLVPGRSLRHDVSYPREEPSVGDSTPGARVAGLSTIRIGWPLPLRVTAQSKRTSYRRDSEMKKIRLPATLHRLRLLAFPTRNFSYSLSVAERRHIQSIHETTELRNPDTLVRYFLPPTRRFRSAWLGQKTLAKLRSDPFYYYLLARTKYYDGVFLDAISDNMKCIINVGCGSDTRSHRFEHILKQKDVKVLECDQREAISGKQRIANRRWTFDYVAYLAIDLNDDAWPDFEHWLGTNNIPKTLVLMEGVSPYVNVDSFGRFLSLLARKLPAGSRVAYDFKLRGVHDDFGRVGRTQQPFRLAVEEVGGYHKELGFRLGHMEQSSHLSARILTGAVKSGAPLFAEDALIQLEVVS